MGCALAPSLDSLIVFRFLAGVGGSACLVCGGGIIADMFPVERRGVALATWTVGPLIGPSVGPLCGAFIAQTIGWRWDFWIVLIPAVIATAVMAIFSQETNHRVLINRKITRLRKETGREDLRSCYDDPNAPLQSRSTIMRNGLIRPLKMLVLVPVLFTISLFVAFACEWSSAGRLLFERCLTGRRCRRCTLPPIQYHTYGVSGGLRLEHRHHGAGVHSPGAWVR